MKLRKFAVVLMLLLASICTYSDITIGNDVRSQISAILAQSIATYKIDQKEIQAYLGNIDRLFSQAINLQKGAMRKDKKTGRTVYSQQIGVNRPIHLNREENASVKAQQPFAIYYVVEPLRRSFIKMLRVPVVKTLTDDEAIQTASEFVAQNRLCKITAHDIMKSAEVLSLRQQLLEPDKTPAEKFTLYHQVNFTRFFRGLKVFGSKQIVCLHPQSKEILGYKSINWMPIDESTQMEAELASANEVIARISKEFDDPDARYLVRKVELGFLQFKGVFSPALAVFSVRTLKKEETIPIQETFIVSLLKNDIPKQVSPRQRPRHAK